MSQTAAERMSRVDTTWLRMDTPSNLVMIVGVWFLRPRITLQALRERVEQRLLGYRRFKQRVVEDALGASWVDDERFDIAHHVRAEPLSLARGTSAEAALEALKTRVGELASEPLDANHALWDFRLVENLRGQSVLIARIHHCIADGIALIAVMLSLTDGGSSPSPAQQAAQDELDWLTEHLFRPVGALSIKAIALAGAGMAKSVDVLMHADHPLEGPAHVAHMARVGAQAVSDVSAFALMPDDSPTRLKGKPGLHKRVAWNDALPLDAVKAVGKGYGCSLNDVMLSCVAGAIGHYLRDKGDDTTGQEIRAMVPVNLRSLAQAHQLGNRFGLVPLVLPIGIEHPIERLYAVRARMRELKGSFQPVLAFGLLAVAGLLIKPVQQAMLNIFARKTTAVMTNVPGPAKPLNFCGAKVERVMFWVPQSGDVGVGVSILTYAGHVQFGLITDSELCPDPEAITARFEPEFNKLLMLSLMLPWEAQT